MCATSQLVVQAWGGKSRLRPDCGLSQVMLIQRRSVELHTVGAVKLKDSSEVVVHAFIVQQLEQPLFYVSGNHMSEYSTSMPQQPLID